MTNGNDSAFSSGTPEMDGVYGLTKREYFAAMAMQGILAGVVGDNLANGSEEMMERQAGITAVRYADALIAALNEQEAK